MSRNKFFVLNVCTVSRILSPAPLHWLENLPPYALKIKQDNPKSDNLAILCDLEVPADP
jgi:hypothetical protein